MQEYNLKDFFKKIDYSWKKDDACLSQICHYTKTRVKPDIDPFKLEFGNEQVFLIKAIAEYSKSNTFFEIGTGRGTACYALSLLPRMQKIVTVDVVPFEEKMNTAIGYKPAYVSNSDIYNMIPYAEKWKIQFYLRNQMQYILKYNKKAFDFCFIDGDHTNPNIIREDFEISRELMKDDGIIIFDDYHLSRFAVKGVVDNILKVYPEYEAAFIKFHGHLFAEENKVDNYGVVVMKKGGLDL